MVMGSHGILKYEKSMKPEVVVKNGNLKVSYML